MPWSVVKLLGVITNERATNRFHYPLAGSGMMSNLAESSFITIDDYLTGEAESPIKHGAGDRRARWRADHEDRLMDGELVTMAV